MKKLLAVCVMLSMWLFGCGNETAGTLSVTAPTAVNGVVTARATFTPSNGSAIPGQPIHFRWYYVVQGTTTKSPELTDTKDTNSTGSATSSIDLPVGTTDTYIVYVIASTGDLTNIEGWQSVVVVP